MKTLILKSISFLLILIALVGVGIAISNGFVQRQEFHNWDTESNLLFLPEGQSYDLVVCGASTGRAFSRAGNHQRTEEILGKSIINLAQGRGNGGLLNQKIYLDYFLQQGNSGKEIVYVVNPSFFFSDNFDYRDELYDHEPFQLDFLSLIIQSGIPKVPVWSYLSSKFKPQWLLSKPKVKSAEERQLAALDLSKRELWKKNTYTEGLDETIFAKKCAVFESVLQVAKERNMKMTVIYPPSLFGYAPGHEMVDRYFASLQSTYDLQVHDFTFAIQDKQLYYDHNHLNTEGIVLFGKTYLKGIL